MSAPKLTAREQRLSKINSKAPPYGKLQYLRSVPFGDRLSIDCFRMANGLAVLLLVDKSAPVVAYHSWFGVGSRHEQPGKTGICHLFEHLMFNEVEGLKAGEFDKKMESMGADNNASTWLDFTQYQEAFPKKYLGKIIELEARRMGHLILREPQVTSEKEVVQNERRFRVEDDVEGTVDELLWKTAFKEHSYRWPTLGWMEDIESFTTEECVEFYARYYAPNNAHIIVVGDISEGPTLEKLSMAYGALQPGELPIEDIQPESPQLEERIVDINQPTETDKLVVGYKGPALGDADHPIVGLLIEILTGGPASRLRRRLIRHDRLASDCSGFVGPHRDPSLIEISISARGSTSAEALTAVVDEEVAKICEVPVTEAELKRAIARTELSLLGGLETADGKASTIGFYQTLLHRPAAAIERHAMLDTVTRADIRRVARRYLRPSARTLIRVRPMAGVDQSQESDTVGTPNSV